ncbi:MAG: bifunctional riboflavin kinase/FAD synthetase [Cyclobacteriaceae bacterium]
MIVLEEGQLSSKIENAIVTSGTFDGVHVGHRKILDGIREQAHGAAYNSVVLTFWPHPRFVVNPNEKALKLLSTFEEKVQLLREANIDYLIKIPFTKEFSKLTSEEFIQKVLIDKIGTKKLVIGYDHHFGKNREGSFDYLQENASRFGFEIQEIPRQDVDHVGVSSTKVRNALLEGKVYIASEYLGRPYQISGKVVSGNNLGTGLGFPTANIKLQDDYKLIPGNGVYAVKVEVGGNIHEGMMNIGNRPTVDGKNQSMEVNIFDFDRDIYNETVTVHFVKRIRDEEKFDGLAGLTAQLHEDKKKAVTILENLK